MTDTLERDVISALTGIPVELLFYAPSSRGYYVNIVIQNMLGSYYIANARIEGSNLAITIFCQEYIIERTFSIADPTVHVAIKAYLDEHNVGDFDENMGHPRTAKPFEQSKEQSSNM